MTTWDKSVLLWIGGGVVGGIIGYFSTKDRRKRIASVAFGSLMVGAIGDKMLENSPSYRGR